MTNTQEMQTSYSIERKIFSCDAKKSLLLDLEEYILRKLNSPERYQVTIVDKNGVEILDQIGSYRLAYFPDTIRSIEISCGSYYSPPSINIKFSINGSDNLLKINIRSNNSRQETEGLSAEIIHIIRSYKNNNFLFNPPLWLNLSLILLIGSAIIPTITSYINNVINPSVYIMRASVFGYFAYLAIGSFIPYCVFDTRRNEKYNKWVSWAMFASLEFIIFGYFLTKAFTL